MPSQLVDDVRGLIRARTEDGRPLTGVERVLLLATLAPPRRGGADVVDELEAAIAHARRILLADPEPPVDVRRATVRRLLAAARGVLDYAPPDPGELLAAAPQDDHGGRRERADVDG